MDPIHGALLEADLFIATGASGSVYPTAGFVTEARGHGTRRCEIKLEACDNTRQFDDTPYGAASEVVPRWVEEVLKDASGRGLVKFVPAEQFA